MTARVTTSILLNYQITIINGLSSVTAVYLHACMIELSRFAAEPSFQQILLKVKEQVTYLIEEL